MMGVREDAITQARSVLAEHFGYRDFRPGQESVVAAVLSGRDALAVMPTGAGKSVCYQVPAVVLPGMTVVVSPLVSLMADQVRSLKEAGIRGAFLNSSLTPAQQAEVLARAQAGAYDLMYVAPERLADPRFTAFAASASIPFVAVDEAHCVSQWGQDFRPSYLAIGEFIAALPTRPVVAALTATATERVRADIVRLLDLRDPALTVTGFDRPNLRFAVERCEPKRKDARLDAFIDERRAESGIVYCSKRACVEEVCAHLRERGIAATRYHAGLSPEERERNQRAFVADDAPVMVATNAFGMGIDKSNVSYVVHYNMPGSVEAYYQEAGRAGRDGAPAECLLLWCDGDIATGRFFIEQESANEALTPEESEVVRAGRRRMLEAMVGYCYTTDCLRRYLLRYFGEDGEGGGGLALGGPARGGAGAAAAAAGDAAAAARGDAAAAGGSAAGDSPELAAPDPRCCSNCAGEMEAVDVTAEARAVMRCVHELRGRFGKTMVVDVLRGADTQAIRSRGLNRAASYGSCDAKRPLLMEVVELLAAGGYLTITEGTYPVVCAGGRYREAARDDFSLRMKRAASKAKRGAAARAAGGAGAVLAASDEALFERLRALRKRLADAAEVPPYVVFPNTTLAAMASARPATAAELLAVPGVGEKKLATYGEPFLTEIAAFQEKG
ncbi:RecQ family ATP-dependent DNA helicase [Adlercreutzia caecimuris]|uniref:RecQ family ATP-dependent DNA helicase n=1 Tax=Adlercreutzia caecimuris TaxID=671266 RepID=UPI002494EB92|nr:RecQ family ATP-dependent DNA helicase [Adlercreutzia caecimuris]